METETREKASGLSGKFEWPWLPRDPLRQGSWRSRRNRHPQNQGPKSLGTLLPFSQMARDFKVCEKGTEGGGVRMRGPQLSAGWILSGCHPVLLTSPSPPPHISPSLASLACSPAPAGLLSLVTEVSGSRSIGSRLLLASSWVGTNGSIFPPQHSADAASLWDQLHSPPVQVPVSPRGLGSVWGWGLLTPGRASEPQFSHRLIRR